MPLQPNLLERLLFFKLNLGPAPLLDLFGAVAFRIVLAAIRLHVFDTLDQRPLTATELAQRLGIDPRGTAFLLDTLAALGYVSATDDQYTNTPMTTKWLVRSSSANVAAGFEYWGTILAELWGTLEESIRTGHAPTNLYTWVEQRPDVSHQFQTWMIATAQLIAGEVLAKLKLPPSAKRLLDVGGGHATYSVALCRRYPQLSATIFDMPQALQTARATIAAEQLGDRIDLQEGDFLKDELGTGYDVVLLFNIVHGFSDVQNIALLGKVAGALVPGGIVVIAEQLAGAGASSIGNALGQMLGLSYFHLLGGQAYSFDEIKRWLTTAGFNQIRRVNLLKAPGNSLIIGARAS